MRILIKSKEILFAKKKFDESSVEDTKFSRVLNLADLAFLV